MTALQCIPKMTHLGRVSRPWVNTEDVILNIDTLNMLFRTLPSVNATPLIRHFNPFECLPGKPKSTLSKCQMRRFLYISVMFYQSEMSSESIELHCSLLTAGSFVNVVLYARACMVATFIITLCKKCNFYSASFYING